MSFRPAAVLLLLFTMVAHAGLIEAQQGGVPQRQTNRDRSDFTMLEEDGFPLNVNPEIVAAADAPIDDGDIVMGIVHNGEARAYPVNYMNGPYNEVVNDHLGGTDIAPSW